jgi:hypothetical protein
MNIPKFSSLQEANFCLGSAKTASNFHNDNKEAVQYLIRAVEAQQQVLANHAGRLSKLA